MYTLHNMCLHHVANNILLDYTVFTQNQKLFYILQLVNEYTCTTVH